MFVDFLFVPGVEYLIVVVVATGDLYVVVAEFEDLFDFVERLFKNYSKVVVDHFHHGHFPRIQNLHLV